MRFSGSYDGALYKYKYLYLLPFTNLNTKWAHWSRPNVLSLAEPQTIYNVNQAGKTGTEAQKCFQRKLCKWNLNNKSCNPNADEKWIAVESLEDVTFSVYLASVDLVKQSHHHKRVEDDGKVLRWTRSPKVRRLTVGINSPTVDVKQLLTWQQFNIKYTLYVSVKITQK